jgi:hypothetical protein
MVLSFLPPNVMFLRWLCERAFRSRVNPAGSGSGGTVAEIPNELNAGAILPATRDSVNTNYYQMKNTQTEERFCTFLYPVPRIAHSNSARAVSFSSARAMKRFSFVPVCLCNPDLVVHRDQERI